jgi:hypothetical protein
MTEAERRARLDAGYTPSTHPFLFWMDDPLFPDDALPDAHA